MEKYFLYVLSSLMYPSSVNINCQYTCKIRSGWIYRFFDNTHIELKFREKEDVTKATIKTTTATTEKTTTNIPATTKSSGLIYLKLIDCKYLKTSIC